MKFPLFFLLLFASSAIAGNIGFGTIKGVKVYDYSSSKVIKIYFSDDATLKENAACNGIAEITTASHPQETIDQWMSIALSAYYAERKIRAFSLDAASCEIDLLILQEAAF